MPIQSQATNTTKQKLNLFYPSILGLPKFESKTDQKLKLPLQRLTSAQMEVMRKLGLCYNCDEKWQMGHRCKGAKLFLLEGWDMEIEQKSGVQLVELEDDEDHGVVVGTSRSCAGV